MLSGASAKGKVFWRLSTGDFKTKIDIGGLCSEKLTNFVQCSFKIYRLSKKKVRNFVSSIPPPISKLIKNRPKMQRAFTLSCNLDILCNKVIDCRPKGHQITSNASSSLHMSIFPRSGQNKSSLHAWEILDVNYGPHNVVVGGFEYLPRIHNCVYFKSNATGHAW